MEFKRKLMSNDKIAETERTIAEQISDICTENKPRFEQLGYELDLRFEYITDEDLSYSVLDFERENKYPIGYVSRATLTLKKPKGEVAEEESVEISEEPESGVTKDESDDGDDIECTVTEQTDEEQEKADRTLKIADEELKRTVAFTHVMLVRVYKTFWMERVSTTDSIERLKEDLEEFYAHLSEKTSD